MNPLLKLLGYRDREYSGDHFSVRVDQDFRELVSVIHTRHGASRKLGGERIGNKWEGIAVDIPPEIDPAEVPQIVSDLETAFVALRYGYVISRKAGIDTVPETERQAALAELGEMGYEIKVSTDRKETGLTWKPGAPRPDMETARRTAPRIMSLLQSVHGTRRRMEILARSRGFSEAADPAAARMVVSNRRGWAPFVIVTMLCIGAIGVSIAIRSAALTAVVSGIVGAVAAAFFANWRRKARRVVPPPNQ